MRLDDVTGDARIEDRRGGGALSGLPGGRGAKIGVPGLIIVVVGFFISQAGGGGGGGAGGIGDVLSQLSAGQGGVSGSVPPGANTTLDAQEQFAGKVITLLNQYWEPTVDQSGRAFREPSVAVFDAPTQTGGCGVGQPEAGPFYCPADDTIYIDFTFYERLEDQLGFDGDFALAYVLAHEYGHHVQNLLGIDEQVREESQGASEADANGLSVQVELQADCFAGVWAKTAYEQDRLESGDFDEAIDAAAAVGDDAIQGAGARRETFTHGSSAERQRWFRTGYDTEDPSRCDTFG
ncbi:MAG: YpfJ protein zinc metalloprotease superfamily [Acidimicrobiales bacterium]|nr:YpfJ protein zinc metalloprotease superfamily [Acidimicrobiales bacterium]